MFLCIKVTCTIHNHLKFASCALTESLHVVDKFVTFLWQSNLWAGAQRSVHDTGKMSYCQLSLHSVLKENQTIKCIRTVNQKSTRLSTNQTCLQTSFFQRAWPLLHYLAIFASCCQDRMTIWPRQSKACIKTESPLHMYFFLVVLQNLLYQGLAGQHTFSNNKLPFFVKLTCTNQLQTKQ